MHTNILTPAAPQPLGHYSQAVLDNGLLFVSGQLPIDPFTSKPVLGPVGEQTSLALRNLMAIVAAAGGVREDILKVTVYISDIAHWREINMAYAAFFGAHRPARSAVPTGRLHFDADVEIEAVARIGGHR